MENLEHNALIGENGCETVQTDSMPEAATTGADPVFEWNDDFLTVPEEAAAEDCAFEDIWNEDLFRAIGVETDVQGEQGETDDDAQENSEEAVLEDTASAEAEESTETAESAQRRTRRKKQEPVSPQESILLYLHDLVYMLAGIIILFLLLFRIVIVSGSSMKTTLYDGDYLLLISNVFYHDPKPGDVIVASKEEFRDGTPIVKRVIATEGQTVYIDFDEGIVYVDGDPIEEPYIIGSTTTDEGVRFPLTVDEGCVFVLGDNRGDSTDSRSPQIGLIDKREIMGKVIFLFLPGHDRYGERDFNRIGAVS